MIRLALEIPTAYLARWANVAWTDLDFALAHKVLEDKQYAEHFRTRPANRELILDNSYHELGYPLPDEALRNADKLCRADLVCIPDALGQLAQNLKWIQETSFVRQRACAVLCGNAPYERAMFASTIAHYADTLCLAFKTDRLTWWHELEARFTRSLMPKRVHLLGVSTLDELRCWTTVANDWPSIMFSVDTGKPLKLAIAGRKMDDGLSIRNNAVSAQQLLQLQDLTPAQLQLADENILLLRTICHGDA